MRVRATSFMSKLQTGEWDNRKTGTWSEEKEQIIMAMKDNWKGRICTKHSQVDLKAEVQTKLVVGYVVIRKMFCGVCNWRKVVSRGGGSKHNIIVSYLFFVCFGVCAS
jgi:hypothetical protein